jgi:plasmid stability protein
MANLTIRKLDPAVKERLRVRAARQGHSMEEEARRILSASLAEEPANAFDRLRRHFADLGGVELELPPRRPGRPLGSAAFVTELEVSLGRELRPRRPGRKPRAAPERANV